MTALGVDHMLVLHDDLEAARQAAARLGFRPTPLSVHSPHMGTANVTVMMPDRRTYIEYLGIVAPTDHNEQMRAALAARGNHVFGLALRGNARDAHRALAAEGLADGDVIDFARDVDLPDGPARAAFSIVQLRPGSLPGLYGIVCEHHTPDAVWRADHVEQPNGARALVGLHGVAAAPAAMDGDWRRVFGDGVDAAEDGTLTVRTTTATLDYGDPGRWAARFGDAADGIPARLLALEFAVDSAAATARWFESAGIACRRDDRSVVVADDLGLGSRYIFTERTPQP